MSHHLTGDPCMRKHAAEPYGIETTMSLPFEQAVARVKELLSREGFGVLCEIDVAATMKNKIGADIPPYVILGACNPPLAFKALAAEPEIGLLLPCNVVLRQEPGKSDVVVSAIDAERALALSGNPALASLAHEVATRLRRVVEGAGAPE
jgi:uncharacterized protein (DUF302 family)